MDIPFVRLLGFDLQVFEHGHAVIIYDPQPDHRNAFGATHGGALMTLLDVTMASAARSVQLDSGLVTIEMKTSFMQTARGRLTSKGRLIHRSTSLAFTEGTVIDEAGRVCAQAMATFKYARPKVDGEHTKGCTAVVVQVARQVMVSQSHEFQGPDVGRLNELSTHDTDV